VTVSRREMREATFFRSRWVDPPETVTELGRDELPDGFRAAGVACGIKRSGDLDVGLLVCDSDTATSAARFTRNALVAAPVTVSRRAELARLRAVVANSGNANVSGGAEGIAVAEAMAVAAAAGAGVPSQRVGVASTGVIGLGLERNRVVGGIEQAAAALSPTAREFAHSLLTTDRWPKYASLEVALARGSVKLCAQAKGGGMISPSFATMLCFVETDAAVDVATLDRLLGAAVERSFDRISVDGQLSTNDSVFALAGGASGIEVEAGDDDELALATALDALAKQLAIEIVADGEGTTRVARLKVRGATGTVEPMARAVANSPLVKCALFGGDPNWGRMLQAAGQALPDLSEAEFDLWIEEIQVAAASVAVPLGDRERGRLDEAMRRPEVELHLALPSREEETEIYFCDLGHEYVNINAEYS
jgi:glutamate N-acetyltransferase / amino-acid N-acetyltransferase